MLGGSPPSPPAHCPPTVSMELGILLEKKENLDSPGPASSGWVRQQLSQMRDGPLHQTPHLILHHSFEILHGSPGIPGSPNSPDLCICNCMSTWLLLYLENWFVNFLPTSLHSVSYDVLPLCLYISYSRSKQLVSFFLCICNWPFYKVLSPEKKLLFSLLPTHFAIPQEKRMVSLQSVISCPANLYFVSSKL